jgi:hypothetical protein
LLPRLTERVDVVDMWARSPVAVSGVLRGLDGEKAEALSTLPIILGMGSKWPHRFSLWHK